MKHISRDPTNNMPEIFHRKMAREQNIMSAVWKRIKLVSSVSRGIISPGMKKKKMVTISGSKKRTFDVAIESNEIHLARSADIDRQRELRHIPYVNLSSLILE